MPKLADAAPPDRFGFVTVAANRFDTITVPLGYNCYVVARWGDPLWSGAPPFDPINRGTGASQERALGDNCDGMILFRNKEKNILAVNNEFVNRFNIYANRWSKLAENADDVHKGKAAHGLSIYEIEMNSGHWDIVQDSPYNRRITADTPMDIREPARGHPQLKTVADPEGVAALGTFNNCGCGRTPWGTYLTCEENFNAYFSASDPETTIPSELARYGIKHWDWGFAWASVDDRFDIAKNPHEPNRFGYVVEIDPLDPAFTPKKRTALNRMKHENAEVVLSADRRVVVYMGDDERSEYLYKFVSKQPYIEGSETNTLLDQGTLYAAKFNEDGRGEWLSLTPETTGLSSIADICIHTRLAASAVQATTMDRPEWGAAHPSGAEVYVCLTNNKNRDRKPNLGGDATPVGGPNPRERNIYGQIMRWLPDEEDHASTTFPEISLL
jgi:secreted PhoX family phosphatase